MIYVKFVQPGKDDVVHEFRDKKAARKWCRARGLTVKDAQNEPGGYVFELQDGEVIPIAPKKRKRKSSPRKPTLPANIRFLFDTSGLNVSCPDALESPDWVELEQTPRELGIGDFVYFESPGVWFQVKTFSEVISNSQKRVRMTVPNGPQTFFLELDAPYRMLCYRPSEQHQHHHQDDG